MGSSFFFAQVTQELIQLHHDSKNFARLFTESEGSELEFSSSVFELMNTFSTAIFHTCVNEKVAHHDERIPLMVWQSLAFSFHAVIAAIQDQVKSCLPK